MTTYYDEDNNKFVQINLSREDHTNVIYRMYKLTGGTYEFVKDVKPDEVYIEREAVRYKDAY